MAETDETEPAATPSRGRFVTGDLMGHVVRMSMAGSVGLLAIFLVDLADLFFISLLGVQELAAAVGFAGAIVFFTTSIGIGLAIAMGALVARAIGAGDEPGARRVATNVLATGLVATSLAAILLFPLLDTLVGWVGAEGRTAELAARYLSIVLPSLPLMYLMMAAGAILRAHGDAAQSMNVTIAAAVVNGVLDPILIFGLDMGLDGAAVASVAARAAGAGLGLYLVRRRRGGFAPLDIAAWRADVGRIMALAGPAVLTNVATPVSAAYLTRVIAEYGDAAVAGYAVVARLTPVAFCLVFALSGAVGPIVGQNFGAKLYPRVAQALTASLKFLALYIVVVSVVLFLISGLIIDAFGVEGEGARVIAWFAGPLSLLFFFNGALFTANAAFNNLGRPFLSTWLNWGRHTLGAIPPATLGAIAFGAPGALLGHYLGALVFASFAVWRAYALVEQRAAPPETEAHNLSWRIPASAFSSWRP